MKKLFSSGYWLLVCLAIFPNPVTAGVTIYAIEIPGLHQKDGGGEYDQIVSNSVVSNGKATLEVLPPARAEKAFADCTNCCFSPANTSAEFYDYGDGVVATDPMNVAKIYIFTAKGSTPISSLQMLSGKRVGIRNGMPYGKSFESAELTTSTVQEIEINIKKLDAGRIDAMVAYVPDAYTAFDALGVEPYPHDRQNPLAVHPDSLVCRGVKPEFITHFNAALP